MADNRSWLRKLVTELRPHAIWEVLRWVIAFVGAVMITAFVRLLEKMRHVSVDWYVSGGLFVVSLGTLAFLPYLARKISGAEKPDNSAAETPKPGALGLDAKGNILPDRHKIEVVRPRIVNVTPEYLIGLFKEDQTTIQTQKLVEDFIRKRIKVSGELADVQGSKDSSDTMVTFAGRSIYKNNKIIMWFRGEEWSDQLATLKPGDKMTVIGQITEVSSQDIHLHRCELVDS